MRLYLYECEGCKELRWTATAPDEICLKGCCFGCCAGKRRQLVEIRSTPLHMKRVSDGLVRILSEGEISDHLLECARVFAAGVPCSCGSSP